MPQNFPKLPGLMQMLMTDQSIVTPSGSITESRPLTLSFQDTQGKQGDNPPKSPDPLTTGTTKPIGIILETLEIPQNMGNQNLPENSETPKIKRKPRVAWTPEAENTFRELYSSPEKWSIEAIATRLGRSTKSIERRRDQLKLRRRAKISSPNLLPLVSPKVSQKGIPNIPTIPTSKSPAPVAKTTPAPQETQAPLVLVLDVAPTFPSGMSTPEKKQGAKRWNTEEENMLKRIFSDPMNKMSLYDIACLLGRSQKAIERKKEKMLLGSSRKNIQRPKPHLNYPDKKPGSSLDLVPAFNLLEDKARCKQPFLPFLELSPTQENPTPATLPKPPVHSVQHQREISKTGTPWSLWDINCLQHYWGLNALGIQDIAIFLYRTVQEIFDKANTLNLPPKAETTPTTKYQINTGWHINSVTVQQELSSEEQHALAELTATRLNHLRTNPCGTRLTEKDAQSEINSLFEVQRHIFHKAIRSKAKKLSNYFSDKAGKEADLIQVGESALFEVISRWNPSEGINFCRATVALNIERQMQQWLRNCRLVKLPSGLIQEIVEERNRLNGDNETPSGKKTKQRKESISRYLYSVHPDRAMVPLTEAYEEGEENRIEQITGGQEVCQGKGNLVEPEHQSFCNPEIEADDFRELMGRICLDLPKEEQYAFCQYNGIGEDGEAIPHKNLRELATECGVSAERIRQRINLAKEKMIKKLARAGIRCSGDAF